MESYKILSKKIVYKNPWWQYCCDQIELPSGKPGEYHYVLTNGSSMVIPETEDGKFLLVQQYRYTGNRDSLEFPCGGLKVGASHEETAKHELREETGFISREMQSIGAFNPCNGLLDESCMVYVARGLSHVGAQPDETESFELVYLTAEEIDGAIKEGTLWDGMTMAAWALAKAVLPGTR